MNLKPFLHQHHLLYANYFEKQEACCDKCNLQIHGWALTCEICNFWLHKSCAVQQLPLEISHPLHSQHPLKLVQEGSRDDGERFFCNGCASLTLSCLYRCRVCNFNLDHICDSSSATITSHSCKEITHFCHHHPLKGFEYRKVSKHHYCCFWCEELLSGISYGCFQCGTELFVHETCLINMPTTISKHHFHPSHLLHLNPHTRHSSCNACGDYFWKWEKGYTCQNSCFFGLHFKCDKSKPSLEHELHEHRLTLFLVQPNRKLGQCMKCKEEFRPSKDDVFDYYYRCVGCGFNYHFRCLIPLSSVKHEYHRHELVLTDVFVEDYSYQYCCDICEQERKPRHPVYCCKECKFVAHIGCALNKTKDDGNFEMGSTSSLVDGEASIGKLMEKDGHANFSAHLEIKYCTGRHLLILNETIGKHESSATCNACSIEITDEAYACKRCKYYIHKTCTRLPFEVLHPLHPQHPLKWSPGSVYVSETFTCEECRDKAYGFRYVCYACDFKLDVKCAISWVPKNETQRLKDMEIRSKLCLFNQDHELRYSNYRPRKNYGLSCSFCGLKLWGRTYSCSHCYYELHESCLGFPWEMQVQFHPLHPLHPLPNPPKTCRACNQSSFWRDISYGCVQCDLYLHVHCAKSLKLAIKSKSHIHDLYYFGANAGKYFDNIEKECGECRRKFSRIPFCFCMECDTKLHTERVLPRSLKSKYHMHPITLVFGLKEQDSGEYYCDICEEERDPRGHVYHCMECRGQFVAHVGCALNSGEETETSSNLVLDSCPAEPEKEDEINDDNATCLIM
ncbi:hypothetical protein V6N13_065155 [Hibiscus sabdariffa]|uniref:Zinc finger PHD-type domain-containing protein n=1 Tax=Hibiscus sabdariffa TaxID=183260 RepID=A0ABR2QRM3_9ROSI